MAVDLGSIARTVVRGVTHRLKKAGVELLPMTPNHPTATILAVAVTKWPDDRVLEDVADALAAQIVDGGYSRVAELPLRIVGRVARATDSRSAVSVRFVYDWDVERGVVARAEVLVGKPTG